MAILVNNAGVVTGRRLMDTTDEDVERTFRVNTLAHYWVCGLLATPGQCTVVSV